MEQFLKDIESKPLDITFNFRKSESEDIEISHKDIDKVMDEIKRLRGYYCYVTICENKYILTKFWVAVDTLKLNDIRAGYTKMKDALSNPRMHLWFVSGKYFVPCLNEFNLTRKLILYFSGNKLVYPLDSNESIKTYIGGKVKEFTHEVHSITFFKSLKKLNDVYCSNLIREFMCDLQENDFKIRYDFRIKVSKEDDLIDSKAPYLTLYSDEEALTEIEKLISLRDRLMEPVLMEMSILDRKYILSEAWVNKSNDFEKAISDIKYALNNPHSYIWLIIKNRRIPCTLNMAYVRQIILYLCDYSRERYLIWGYEDFNIYVGDREKSFPGNFSDDYRHFFREQIKVINEIERKLEGLYRNPNYVRRHGEYKGGY